jgi:energy-coupling factor transporter ATP-binding protein EcfA2
MIEAAWRGRIRSGVSVGLECLDRVTAGIREDDVWFIGGRTSMGKSVLATVLARAIAEQGRGVMFNSPRNAAARGAGPADRRIAYDPSAATTRFRERPLWRHLRGRGTPDSTPRPWPPRASWPPPAGGQRRGGLTIEDIRSPGPAPVQGLGEGRRRPRRHRHRSHRPGPPPHQARRLQGRRDGRRGQRAEGPRQAAPRPVIALCQVNRNTENRNDHKPTLAT